MHLLIVAKNALSDVAAEDLVVVVECFVLALLLIQVESFPLANGHVWCFPFALECP